MKLTVVGCSGSFPGPTSPASCYLVEHDDTKILLDMGNGSLGALFSYAEIYGIDAVALSHLHIDHCADVGSYYVARRYRPGDPAPKIPILGPPGTAERLAAMYGLDDDPGMTAEFDFIDHTPGNPVRVGSVTIEPFAVSHAIESFALRVTADHRVLTYSGDTGPCQGLEDAARNADVALFEASYLERHNNPANMHLTGADAAKAAVRARAKRLVLTHLVAWNDPEEVIDDAAPHNHPDVSLAQAGLTVEI